MEKASKELFQYHQQMHPERVAFLRSEGNTYFATQSNPKKMHGFALLWTAHSISMTKYVDTWIRSAGERCKALGINSIGESLITHARHEAGHDQMLVEDLAHLVGLWNKNYGGAMSVQEIMTIPLPENSQKYIELHEEVIKSHTPFAQVAIEFEIERLSVTVIPRWVENILCTLGQEFSTALTFLDEHILLDQGHTKFNTNLLEKCFAEGLDSKALVTAGRTALQCYAGYLGELVKQTDKYFPGA